MGKYVIGFWDCNHCGKKGIKATVRSCPSCGVTVGDNVKYYMNSSSEYIAESEVPTGPDWKCNYCNSYNRFSDYTCSNCGGEKTGTKDYFENLSSLKASADSYITEKQDESSSVNTDSSAVEEVAIDKPISYNTSMQEVSTGLKTSAIDKAPTLTFDWLHNKRVLRFSVIILGVIALIAALIFIFVPRERTITVDSFSWTRELRIEKYKTYEESGWYLPTTAEVRLQYTRQEIHHYEQVLMGYKEETYTEREITGYEDYVSGYRDCGNGVFEEIHATRPIYTDITKTRSVPQYEDRPVYQTKYYYDIDRFGYERSVITQGADKKPYWGEAPTSYKYLKVGVERVGSRLEKYTFMGHTAETPKLKEYTLNYKEWESLSVGDTVECYVYINGAIKLKDKSE